MAKRTQFLVVLSAAYRNVPLTLSYSKILAGVDPTQRPAAMGPVDRQTAQRWFRAAAELGHGQAQLMLGRYLTNGLAGDLKPKEGRLWLERAAAQGTAEAESEVAALTGNTGSAVDELEDLARALRRSRMASEQAQPAAERE